jgi:LPS sulfotransferase NodH
LRPTLSYFVCTTPRTGSNLLCEALRNTGMAGNPEEYFWDDALPAWYERWGISTFEQFLERLLAEGTTPNGVFGVKVFAGDYLEDFLKHVRRLPQYSDPRLPVPALMSSIFPNLRYIWLTRRSKVRQAVSWWLAFQTKVWALRSREDERPMLQVTQALRNTNQPQQDVPRYDFEKIDSLVQEIVRREAWWQEYFSEGGIRPLSVVYEDFADAYEENTSELLRHLGIDAPPQAGSRDRILQKQAGTLTEEWVRRYLEEKRTGWQPTWHTEGVL